MMRPLGDAGAEDEAIGRLAAELVLVAIGRAAGDLQHAIDAVRRAGRARGRRRRSRFA